MLGSATGAVSTLMRRVRDRCYMSQQAGISQISGKPLLQSVFNFHRRANIQTIHNGKNEGLTERLTEVWASLLTHVFTHVCMFVCLCCVCI